MIFLTDQARGKGKKSVCGGGSHLMQHNGAPSQCPLQTSTATGSDWFKTYGSFSTPGLVLLLTAVQCYCKCVRAIVLVILLRPKQSST